MGVDHVSREHSYPLSRLGNIAEKNGPRLETELAEPEAGGREDTEFGSD